MIQKAAMSPFTKTSSIDRAPVRQVSKWSIFWAFCLSSVIATAQAGVSVQDLSNRVTQEYQQAQTQYSGQTALLNAIQKQTAELQALLSRAQKANPQEQAALLTVVEAGLNGEPLPKSLLPATSFPRNTLAVRKQEIPNPTAEDLADTEDAPLTPEIQALAASLENNPVQIVNWVQEHITPLPGTGSLQGAAGVLRSGRGNPADTSHLLVALLRAAKIPARYVTGTIELPEARLRGWLGTPVNTQESLQLLTAAGMNPEAQSQGGKISAVRMDDTAG